MTPSKHLRIQIDVSRIRQNMLAIARKTKVPIIAVVKADAYGLGADMLIRQIDDLVDAYYFFSLEEVVASAVHEISQKRSIVLTGNDATSDDYRKFNARPVVWSISQALALKNAKPILSIETGQGRFACPREKVAEAIAAGEIRETMTHATRIEQVDDFISQMNNAPGGADQYYKHVAGSGLLNEPRAWLQATRPGLAMYDSAVRVSAQLHQVTDAVGPVGYQRLTVERYGIILAGYSNGLRTGPCMVNGNRRRIFEVGMQTSFVELSSNDKNGDEIELLGSELGAAEVAKAWSTTSQEALLRLASSGNREYSNS